MILYLYIKLVAMILAIFVLLGIFVLVIRLDNELFKIFNKHEK